MNFLFALLVLVALVVCTLAQWPYTYSHAVYPYAYNYGVYNPALSYYWK